LELADLAGLSERAVSDLERGLKRPHRETVRLLIEALGLAPDGAEELEVAARSQPPPAFSTANGRASHNLPSMSTSFVGREQDLQTIPARLQRARMLTLTGVGGSGKTRLALEVGRHVAGQYRDGARLVELAPITDPALVPDRVAAAVPVQMIADRPLEQILANALRSAHMLLVLDNCEHLLDARAALIDLLLRECPSLHVLATSREPIGIPGEVNWSLPPLATPAPGQVVPFAEIERSPTVRVFVDRASAAQRLFVLDGDNADSVAQICRCLDGLPLALELAAARLDALTVEELARRLDRRLSLLNGGNRAAQPRQQTLRATIDWSYQFLTPTQQRVFERLSVFANGWTLHAADAVCAGDGVADGDVLDALLQLIRKSLVMRLDVRHGSARYRLLETLREYASEKLTERGVELSATRQRHAAYYSALVQRLDPASPTTLLPYSGETLTAPVFGILDDAHDNVQFALRWLEMCCATEGLQLLRALAPLWMWVGLPVDGPRWMKAMLDLAANTPGVQPAMYAQALTLGGIVAQMEADAAKSRTLLEKSVALWRLLDDPVGLAMALANLGFDHAAVGEFAQAEAILCEGLALAKQGGEVFTHCHVYADLSRLAYARQQYAQAAAYAHENLSLGRSIERASYRTFAVIWALVTLGNAELKLGATHDAISRFTEALTIVRESAYPGFMVALCLDAMASALCATGDALGAARLFGAADTHWQTIGVARGMLVEPRDDDVRAALDQLGEPAFWRAWNEGRMMGAERAVSVALDP
ncbi:MAG TPA: helix-turn-helix domain-containing protein, partial [Chloroflexota bacterium]|nr:helix-turn-helix domain-containing protein [Chloroflexota bacterium]